MASNGKSGASAVGSELANVLNHALNDLSNTSSQEVKSNGKGILFPNGINFISISIKIDPSNMPLSADLVISSEPVNSVARNPSVDVGDKAETISTGSEESGGD